MYKQSLFKVYTRSLFSVTRLFHALSGDPHVSISASSFFATLGLFTKEDLSSQACGNEGLVDPDTITLVGWRLTHHVVGQKVAGSPADVAKVDVGVGAIDECLLALRLLYCHLLSLLFVLMFLEENEEEGYEKGPSGLTSSKQSVDT